MDLLTQYLQENNLLDTFQQQFQEHDINLEQLLILQLITVYINCVKNYTFIMELNIM